MQSIRNLLADGKSLLKAIIIKLNITTYHTYLDKEAMVLRNVPAIRNVLTDGKSIFETSEITLNIPTYLTYQCIQYHTYLSKKAMVQRQPVLHDERLSVCIDDPSFNHSRALCEGKNQTKGQVIKVSKVCSVTSGSGFELK